ncbi:hypothetical protein FDC61_09095 [Clostridium botulinum]|nr:hypothetical protein [Clostridium botulinum]
MNNIIFKTVDGVVYGGELTYFGKEELSVKNLLRYNDFDDDYIKESKENSCENENVWFYINKIIWYRKKC